MIKQYKITPVPKPRQTRADKWKQRPCVMRYRAFADEVRRLEIQLPHSVCHVIFIIPMPKSWSEKKRLDWFERPHQQTPDIDNLFKALADAVYKSDCKIWDVRMTKLWGFDGKIIIKDCD